MHRIKFILKSKTKYLIRATIFVALLLPSNVYANNSGLESHRGASNIPALNTPLLLVNAPKDADEASDNETSGDDHYVIGIDDSERYPFINETKFSLNEARDTLTLELTKEMNVVRLLDTNKMEYLYIKDVPAGKSTHDLPIALYKSSRYYLEFYTNVDDIEDEVKFILLDSDRQDDEREYLRFDVSRFRNKDDGRLEYTFEYEGEKVTVTEKFGLEGYAKIDMKESPIMASSDTEIKLKLKLVGNPKAKMPDNIRLMQADSAGALPSTEIKSNGRGVYTFKIENGDVLTLEQVFENTSFSIQERRDAVKQGLMDGYVVNPDSLEREGLTEEGERAKNEVEGGGDGLTPGGGVPLPMPEVDSPLRNIGRYLSIGIAGLGVISLAGWVVMNQLQKRGKKK